MITNLLQGQEKEKKSKKWIDNFSRTIASETDSAFYFITKAVYECQKEKDTFSLSRCYYNLGYYYYIKKDYKESENYTNKAFPLAKKSNNYPILSLIYNQLGLIYRDQAKYNKALKYFQTSLDIAERRKLIKNQSIALNNLGYIFELQNDTIKALQYYKMTQSIALRNNLKFELLASYNNIAILKKEYNKSQSIESFNKAYGIALELNDKYEQFNVLINLSDIYLSYNNNHKSTVGYNYLLKAKEIAESLKDNNLMFYVYYNLGGYHLKKRNHERAIGFYEQAINLFKSGIPEDQKLSLLKDIELAYKKANNYKKAYFFKQAHSNLKDSIFNIKKNKSFHEIQTKYEVEKKNLKIDLLTKEGQIEKERRKLIIFIGIVLIVVLGSILFFFIHRANIQQLINEKENKIHHQEVARLEQEKEMKRIRGIIEGQDNERNRIAKEIHDGIGGDLAGIKLHLSQVNSVIKNETIQNVIDQVSKAFHELRNISHNLSSNYIHEKSFESLLNELKREYENRLEFKVEIILFPNNVLLVLSKDIKHHLYRIIQELLTNVSKHARAKNVSINITGYDANLSILVEDDGKGFSHNINKGIGMKNIEERLSLMKGEMIIDSAHAGTSVIINIPNQSGKQN